MLETAREIALWSLPILVAVVFHEAAHGYVAKWLGDSTAERAGRLTLNPLPHVDPIGTVAVPLLLVVSGAGFLFGWARPVPVDFGKLGNPRRDMVLVAAAGPLTNLVLAIGFAGLFYLVAALGASAPPGWSRGVVGSLLVIAQYGILMNVFLGVFNLFPLPPLDGGRVMVGLLPPRLAWSFSRVEPYGFFILVALLVTGVLGVVVGPPVRLLLRWLLPVVGGPG